MGTYFGGINTLAGAMKELGLFLGVDLGNVPPGQPHFYEDTYIGDICRNSYSEPWLEENTQYDRISQLRRWAGLQCKHMPKEVPLLCGKHPMLSLVGSELMEAWNNPKFICIERSPEECYESMKKVDWCWHPSAAKHAFNRLADAREEFFATHQPPLLRIRYDALKSAPERVFSELCAFLQHVPTAQQRRSALKLVNQTSDDLCYQQEIVKQPVQVVQEVQQRNLTHPLREKRKIKRKKR
jgi:hypothetical protein